jgi:hypothetical protein
MNEYIGSSKEPPKFIKTWVVYGEGHRITQVVSNEFRGTVDKTPIVGRKWEAA